MKLPVAILAGGLATRLHPATEKIPKALIDINGEPFVFHQLRLLKKNGIERVVICAGYLGEMIMKTVGNGTRFGIRVEYSFDGAKLLGTGGAIKQALPKLGEAFMVLYGDSYLPCDYQAIETEFDICGKLALMTVFKNQGLWDKSNVEFGGGRILAYDKRAQTPQMQHIDYGLGAFRSSAFESAPDGGPYDLALLYQDLLRRSQLAAFEVTERFYEVGSFEGLEEARNILQALTTSLA